MLVKYPFFGSIVVNLDYVKDNEHNTIATNGKTVFYNTEFIETLTEKQQVFVFAHEVCHIAFNHLERRNGKNFKVWNVATDAVINAFLKKDGLELVEGCVDMPEAINYDADTLYEKLLKELEEKKLQKDSEAKKSQKESEEKESQKELQKQNESSSEEMDSNSSEQQVGHDKHDLWENMIEKKKSSVNEQEHENQEEKNGQQAEKTLGQEQTNKKLEEKIKEISQMGEKNAFEENKKEKVKQFEKLKNELAKQSIGAGITTNSLQRRIENIGISKPLIDWRRLLKEAVKVDVDWSYKNAGIEDGIVRPYLEEEMKPETEIVLDTSGSVNETLLRNFLRECKNILKTSKVKVGCFDTKFYGFQELRKLSDIDNLEFVGGGGTDFDVAVNAFSRRVENKIIFTDGEADMPYKSLNAIWIVFGDRIINPNGGKVINITREQLRKLYRSDEKDYDWER